MRAGLKLLLLVVGLIPLLLPDPGGAGRRRTGVIFSHEAVGQQLFASPQVNPIVLSTDGSLLYVAATTSNRVDVFATATNSLVTTISVGIDPGSLAMRPDGLELWVSNHVSDSVSVIDTDSGNPTYHQVIATIQDVDGNGGTLFDEPVGIAFTGDSEKAYVALSSRNDIAVVETSACTGPPPCNNTNEVVDRLHITAQDPRAITVQGNFLYVAAFESSNQTEISSCPGQGPTADGQCTMDEDDLANFIVQSPNIPGAIKNIVRDTDVPDRDIFVFNTGNDNLVDTIEGVGTLLYGVAVDQNDRLYVTLTEAINDINGRTDDPEGDPPHDPDYDAPGDINGDLVVNLDDMDNQMFLNQLAIYDCSGGSCTVEPGSPVDLEPSFPDPALALATPYGVAVTTDTGGTTTLVATAAASSRIFTTDDTGALLSQLDVGAIPRGLALATDVNGAPETAYVLNTLGNTVTVVDVSDPSDLPSNNASPAVFAVGNDPTPANVQLGRIAFNDAFGSDSGNFACASCHPDAHTDQLLWRIGGRDCVNCVPDEDEPRTTMPIRGLANTLPLHWDGTLGDPFGGPNGQIGNFPPQGIPANCTLGPVGDPDREHACFRHLVDASLSGVMCEQNGGCQVSAAQNGPDGSGLPGQMTDTERENMGFFLASVAYPPPRSRPIDDVISSSALQGFSDFFVDDPVGGFNGDFGDLVNVDTCADMDSGCHSLPLGVDDNSATLGGFEVPTMRGMTDRFVQFSMGITIPEEVMVFFNSAQSVTIDLGTGPQTIPTPASQVPWDPADGYEEEVVLSSAFAIFQPFYGVFSQDIFQMFEEASTGFAGVFGRQLTLTSANASDQATIDAMTEFETADAIGLINLRATGIIDGVARTLSYFDSIDRYRDASSNFPPSSLRSAMNGANDVMTLTAELRSGVGTTPVPLLLTDSHLDGPFGNPNLPIGEGMSLGAIDVHSNATVLVDGQPVALNAFLCLGGAFTPYCDSQNIIVQLTVAPPNGLHLIQVQNPAGALSNEMPFCMGSINNCD